jgi:methionyl-tRNA synthetase
MAGKYVEGRLARITDRGLQERAKYFTGAYAPLMNGHEVSAALAQALGLAGEANQYVEQTSPWKLAKQGERQALDTVLYHLAESLRIIAILVSPVLPKAAHGIFDQLNWKMELSGKEERFSLKDAEWGTLPDGHVVGKPVPLFPRIEIAVSG